MSLTIKQAFEALSDACANGMKNPFFVMRRLKESFADVADKVVDAGGSEVTVTPIVTEGTKIATITVDDVESDLYAPNASVSQTITEGTEIAEIDGTKIFAPSSSGVGNWTLLGHISGNQTLSDLNLDYTELCCIFINGNNFLPLFIPQIAKANASTFLTSCNYTHTQSSTNFNLAFGMTYNSTDKNWRCSTSIKDGSSISANVDVYYR